MYYQMIYDCVVRKINNFNPRCELVTQLELGAAIDIYCKQHQIPFPPTEGMKTVEDLKTAFMDSVENDGSEFYAAISEYYTNLSQPLSNDLTEMLRTSQ